MTRGKKPVAAIAEAKSFAERMGYRSLDNTDNDLPFDFLIYKPESIRLVTVRQTRFRIDPYDSSPRSVRRKSRNSGRSRSLLTSSASSGSGPSTSGSGDVS